MKIRVEENYRQMSCEAARIIAGEILRNPNLVLGLPTGNTPKCMYEKLANLCKEGVVDFSQVVTFNLDEYYDLPFDHEKSFHRYMEEKFFSRVNILPQNTYIPNGMTDSVERECKNYDRKISEQGGIDLIVLGIGPNGHIGFNEPGTRWDSATRLVELTEKTITREFDRSQNHPRKALTMGIKNIMRARKVLLLASGEKKAEIVDRTINGPISNDVPSTILQLHPDLRMILDEGAAGKARG